MNSKSSVPPGGREAGPGPGRRGLALLLGAALLLPLLLLPAPASGQDASDDARSADGAGASREDAAAASPPVPELRAVSRTGPVAVDGRLRERAWERAPAATGFVQREPVEGAPAEDDTEVRVLYDGEALYVGARMHDSEPSRIADRLVRRDERCQCDWFAVSLDPNGDRRTGYHFQVSAAGVQSDLYLYDDVREDENWDAVWESAVTRDSLGWVAELRIPLSQIRYDPAAGPQTWGVNFSRRRVASNERTFFSLESRLEHGKVSAFGELEGVELTDGARRVEVRPYVLAGAHTGPAEEGDPFFDGSETSARTGVDLRYGLGGQFNLDATVNPDFGQVEVDPAVVNLSAFETFFPEKRPFFVEDAQLFDFTLSGHRNRLFYSRRIGREPQGNSPDGADFTDVPAQTSILGAGKVTGRTDGGLTMGVLAAVTEEEEGRAYYDDTGLTEPFVAQPRSEYGVLRLRQDFRDGASQVGAILAGMHRELPAGGAFDFLPSTALNAGLDFEHQWGGERDRDWALHGFFAASHVRGSPEAMVRVQRSSNHYFQRPDATRLSVDSAATRLTGYEWRLQFERRSAEHWTWSVWAAEVSPGFEVNDIGFSQSGERLDGGARISYRDITPGEIFRSVRLSAWTFHNWRHEALDDPLSLDSWDRAHQRGALSLNGRFEFLNYWNLNLSVRASPESLSGTKTRGGPLMVDPGSRSYSLRGSTDRRSWISVEPRLEYRDGGRGGSRVEGGFEVELRPSSSVELEIGPRYSRELEPAQYVTSASDPGYDPTYGSRYLFGELERKSFSLETRLNVAFTPELTLQVFAQPLISAGDYRRYRALVRASSFDLDDLEEGTAFEREGGTVCLAGRTCREEGTRYVDFEGDGEVDVSFADRDFNVRSLRGNAVLRWEYRPGSTLFLVWQQNRRTRVNDGTFELGRDVDELLALESENRLILKANYWLGF